MICTHAAAQAPALFIGASCLPPTRLPDTQTRLAFGYRGIPGQLVDQSCGKPHVGLELRLISQEYARGPRLEPVGERTHFQHCQWSNFVVSHWTSPMVRPDTECRES